jgi:hypothetical protein
MCDSVRGGAMKASSVKVVTGKEGILLVIRDIEPFFHQAMERRDRL